MLTPTVPDIRVTGGPPAASAESWYISPPRGWDPGGSRGPLWAHVAKSGCRGSREIGRIPDSMQAYEYRTSTEVNPAFL